MLRSLPRSLLPICCCYLSIYLLIFICCTMLFSFATSPYTNKPTIQFYASHEFEAQFSFPKIISHRLEEARGKEGGLCSPAFLLLRRPFSRPLADSFQLVKREGTSPNVFRWIGWHLRVVLSWTKSMKYSQTV